MSVVRKVPILCAWGGFVWIVSCAAMQQESVYEGALQQQWDINFSENIQAFLVASVMPASDGVGSSSKTLSNETPTNCVDLGVIFDQQNIVELGRKNHADLPADTPSEIELREMIAMLCISLWDGTFPIKENAKIAVGQDVEDAYKVFSLIRDLLCKNWCGRLIQITIASNRAFERHASLREVVARYEGLLISRSVHKKRENLSEKGRYLLGEIARVLCDIGYGDDRVPPAFCEITAQRCLQGVARIPQELLKSDN